MVMPRQREITPQMIDAAERYFRSIAVSQWMEIREFLLRVPLFFRLGLLKDIAEAGGALPDMESLSIELQAAMGYVPIAARRSTQPAVGPRPPVAYRSSAPVPRQCTVNGFDTIWGTPPSSYLGIAMAFDAQMGVYRFDSGYAARYSVDPVTRLASYKPWDLRDIQTAYSNSLWLQPHRRSLGGPWEFRWIALPRTPVVECRP
jgi:hypothetical protein